MFPKLKDSEITSEVLQQYLMERIPKPRRRKDLEILYASYDKIVVSKMSN